MPTWWQGRNDWDDYALWCAKHLPKLSVGETRHAWGSSPSEDGGRVFMSGEWTSALSAGGRETDPRIGSFCTAREALQ